MIRAGGVNETHLSLVAVGDPCALPAPRKHRVLKAKGGAKMLLLLNPTNRVQAEPGSPSVHPSLHLEPHPAKVLRPCPAAGGSGVRRARRLLQRQSSLLWPSLQAAPATSGLRSKIKGLTDTAGCALRVVRSYRVTQRLTLKGGNDPIVPPVILKCLGRTFSLVGL